MLSAWPPKELRNEIPLLKPVYYRVGLLGLIEIVVLIVTRIQPFCITGKVGFLWMSERCALNLFPL